MKDILYLVRHGEAEGNIERKFHGHYNSKLTEIGHLQAEKAAERLLRENIDVLYSSDLERAYDTAKYISQQKDLPIHTTKQLREINGGEWVNVPWDELPLKFKESYQHWENDPHLLQMPGGESMEEFCRRVVSAIESIVAENKGKNVCIVTHGTAIRVFLCYFYGLGLDKLALIPWHDNTAISMLDVDKRTVVFQGDNFHLGDLSTLSKQDWWKRKVELNVLDILKEANVLQEGHFLLTSGRHSSKYLQCAKIFQYAKYSEPFCEKLAERFKNANVQTVIGPAMGAIQMAYEVARHLGAKNIFAERVDGAMALRRGFEVNEGEKVLVVEDVVTTGGSVQEVIELVRSRGGVVVGVGVIVDRSGGKIDFGVPFEALQSIEVESYAADNCPLCIAGHPITSPGSRKRS